MTLQELATGADLKLSVNMVPWGWLAKFADCEVKNGPYDPILSGAYGRGATAEEALEDYAALLRGKVLVRNAMSDKRWEFCVPETLTHGGKER
jgi:hypothetical protein